MNTRNTFLRNEKIASVQQEFHERNDLEIQPGYRVNDLVSREERHRAQGLLTSEINAIVAQIENARLAQAKGQRQIDTVWLTRAQQAIRWKRRIMSAVHAKLQALPRINRDAFRQTILDVIRDDIGEERMQSYVQEARARIAAQSEGGESC